MRTSHRIAALLTASTLAALGACSSSKSSPGTDHVVTLSWAANREAGVNRAGGGYTIAISGQGPLDVPYVSGAAAPTTKDVTLRTGTYTVTVSAYAALDPSGGAAKTSSAPSQALTVQVP